jgi:uncharacterized RDD family membrane protein YckC
MTWYYVEAGQRVGPIEETQLEGLARVGKIQPETLVWREGMTDWQPYRSAKVEQAPGTGVAIALAGPDEAVCAECGRVFNRQEMIPHGNLHVCATCKPILVQKLAEGVTLKTGTMNYAGFWLRFAAVFLDGILLFMFNTLLNLLAGGLSFPQSIGVRQPGFALTPVQIVLFFVEMAVGLSYEAIMIGKFGATVGKYACGIKVVTAEGGRVSYLRAFGRYFAKLLSSLICAIGYIMAGFDEEKRALHDRICNTRVIFRD